MPELHEQSIFIQALERDPAERGAFLDGACVADPALRQRVERLLHHHEHAASFLAGPAAGSPETRDAVALAGAAVEQRPLSEGPGSSIGRYKLLEQIGEGGMGVVFVAEQTRPVRRQVALKVIKAGMDTKQVVARFQAERQALALMDHPNIAKVLDAGATESGRPYFVMELVKGVPITRYCDEHRLTPRDRLGLFVQVCQAVQHAHQKGIIHRDLKPSNVLVAQYDGKPVPKVIDFGVAKATGGRLTEQTLYTGFGAVVGTPEYMSPEQAELNQLDVDTRSDVYSLGVILYELLTGSTPVERGRFKQAALLEVLRVVREEEPPKPSTRLSTTDQLASIAACRGLEPGKLGGVVRGELDWIVMRCLEKDRARRYETAVGLARDVERYLADEAVHACPPTAAYRFRKFARRNKGPVLSGGLVALALVAGIIGTSIGMARARQSAEGQRIAKQQALADKANAVAAAEAEKKANAQAQRRLAQIEKGNAILTSIFSDLNPVAEEKEGKPLRALLGERLAQAADQLEGEAVGDPLVVASLQNQLGIALGNLGMRERAIPLLEKARATWATHLGPDHRSTLTAMHNLAGAYRDDGKLELALSLHEQTFQLRKAKLGPGHRETLYSMSGLALAYRDAGKMDLALPLFEDALELSKVQLGLDHPSTLVRIGNLAQGYHSAGKLDLALPLYEESLRLHKEIRGPGHIHTLTSMHNLATAYRAAGKLDLAMPLFEEALKVAKGNLGPDHPSTIDCLSNLAGAHREAGKVALAVPLYEEALKLRKARFGPEHPQTLTTMNNLALAYDDAGKPDLALSLFEEGLRLTKATLGADHPDTLVGMSNLGAAYSRAGKSDLALPLLEEALKLRQSTLGPDHPHTVLNMSILASAYAQAGKPDLALPLAQKAAAGIELRRFEHANAVQVVDILISCHEVLKQFDQAETLRRKWLTVVKERSGSESAAYARELAALGRNLLKQEKWGDAEAAFCEVVRLHADDAWLQWIAGACVEAGYYAVADAALGEAARLKPDSAGPHYALGNGYARLGQWDKAAAAFGRGLELDPANHERWYQAAALHLAAGDREGYRRACREMVGRFAQSDDPATAERTAKACSLTPGAVADFGGVEALAQRAVAGTENHPYYRFFVLTKGLTECRAGRHAEAVQWLERFAPRADGVHWDATALAALAIARHGLGHAEQAAAALDRAKAIVAGKMPDPAGGRPFDDGNWHDWLHAQVLCREADALLKEGG